MASNIECIPFIITAFQTHLSSIVSLIDKTTATALDKLIATLLNRILQLCVYHSSNKRSKDKKEPILDREAKKQLSKYLCPLLKASIGCLRGGQSLQYTALLMINKTIDVLIVYGVSTIPFIDSQSESTQQSSFTNSKSKKQSDVNKRTKATNALLSMESKLTSSLQTKSSTFKESRLKSSNLFQSTTAAKAATQATSSSSLKWIKSKKATSNNDSSSEFSKPMTSKFNHENLGQSSSEKIKSPLSAFDKHKDATTSGSEIQISTLLNILLVEGLDLLLNVLNNAITLHKRVTGSKQTCTPSHRWRHCTYHCLQILSARALLFISQSSDSRKRFVEDGPLKVLLSSLDSTHDPQLLCLVLQIMASIAIDPLYQKHLIDAELPDILMQLILPSDEWFYTNHSTKYARYVKHHAARILVYMGLEKRLRNKVYLFDLLEEMHQSAITPSSDTEEDVFITKTSISPSCVFTVNNEQVKGASLEGMVLEILTQIEKKIVYGESSDGDLSLCDGNEYLRFKPLRMVPPAIQVDLVSSKESSLNQRSSLGEESDHLSPIFYLSSFPICINPLIFLRLLQHRMFGCVAFWSWPSNAVSRSSVASSYGENRSRASSTCGSNIEEPPLRTRRNVSLTITCPASGFSSSKTDIDRRCSLKSNFPEDRIVGPFIALPQVQKPRPSIDKSIAERTQNGHQETPVTSPSASSARKSFKFSSFKRKRAKSTDKSSPPLTCIGGNAMQADIVAFQRELQNIPRNETSPIPTRTFPSTMSAYCSSMLSSYINEALERSLSPSMSRPRSCSVPRTTFEGMSLQLPVVHQHRASASGFHLLGPVARSSTCETSYAANTQIGRSPASLSPNGGRSSSTGIHLHCGESPVSSGSNRSGSVHHREEVIMPNAHRAILRLLMDWARLASYDLKMNLTVMKELNDFLARVSLLGDQYQWRAEEIRIYVDLQDTNILEECHNQESATNEYLM
ncbi:1-phosphatidylinositol 4:5-bisphosphate phosphodiesterase epsilon-1-like protein, partial [Dinothrombium tinctorium]